MRNFIVLLPGLGNSRNEIPLIASGRPIHNQWRGKLMHAQEPADISDQLHVEQTRLLGHIADLTDATRPIKPDCALGRLGRIEAIQYQSVQKAELLAARQRLRLINAALAQLAQGRYGRCELCGEEIPAGRLKVCPEALRCTACAEL